MAAVALSPSISEAGCDYASYPEKFKTHEFVTVQQLVESQEVTERSIPSQFLKIKEEQLLNCPSRPVCHTEDYSIPIIDMKALSWEEQALAVGHAFEEWGACILVNHSIPLQLMQNVQKATLDFFNLPLEKKMAYPSKADNPFHASVQYIGGPQNDWRDLLKLISFPRKYADFSRWPEVSGFRELMQEYTDKTQSLASTMYELVSVSLGLDRNYFARTLGSIGQASVLPYYPKSPNPDKTIGNRSHTDTVVMTFVLQDDVGGLQLLKNGNWIDCKPMEGSLLVNCGDTMQALTNSKYRSVYHRVLSNSEKTRLSILSFISALNHVKISPIPELLDADNPPMYPTLYSREITQSFMKKNFGFGFLDSLELKNAK